jgi:uncharacterized protein (TIGR03067 family)
MLGEMLGDRYKVLEVLGASGMGQAYIAEDTQRPGSPKCVVKHLKPLNGDPAFAVTAQRLFIGEAEALEKLGTHDQISKLFAYFERDGEFYLVQEFIEGHTLNAELPLGQRWSEPQVVAMLKDILPILEFIHSQGVIHRDIKPDNIVRRKQDGKLVLIDFGAVKQIQMQQTSGGQGSMTVAIGTPGYMPTEQSSGKPRFNSDIYALGMISIQALTGLLPSQLREDEDGEVIWRDQAEASKELIAVITMMTRHYFKNRYQSATEVLQAIGSPLPSPSVPTPSINVGYTPTQAVDNSVYNPTVVAHNNESTETTSANIVNSEKIEVSENQRSTTTVQNNVISHVDFSNKEKPSKNKIMLLVGGSFLALIGLLASILTPSPDKVPLPKVATIQGTWKIDGFKVPAATAEEQKSQENSKEFQKMIKEMKGTSIIINNAEIQLTNSPEKQIIVIDDTKSPKQLDILNKKNGSQCIYEITPDESTVAMNILKLACGQKDRPSSFENMNFNFPKKYILFIAKRSS